MAEGGRGDDPASSARSMVAFYGADQPSAFASVVAEVQSLVGAAVGSAFQPRPVDTTHSTLIGLQGPADPVGFARLLREVLAGQSVTLQFGGFPDHDLGLTSRGQRLHDRSLVADRGQVVLIGWPVDGDGRPLPTLDRLRRQAGRFGIEHRYHLSDSDSDPDAHVVVGELDERLPAAELTSALARARAALAGRPWLVPLRWSDLCVVTYDDTRLPLDTTTAVSLGELVAG